MYREDKQKHRLKVYRSIKSAKKHCAGGPIIQVNDLFIVPEDGETPLNEFTQILLLGPRGREAALIRLRHFDRLGNANQAYAPDKGGALNRYFVFPINGPSTPPEK